MTAVQQPWIAGAGATAHSGNLSNVPFAELLVGLLGTSASGTLRIHDDRGSLIAVISFDQGVPVAASLARPESSLNASLIPLCARSEGTFAFQANRDELAGLPSAVRGRVDPLALITSAMRGPMREDAVTRTLNDLRNCLLKLSPRAELDRYGLSIDERNTAELMREQPIPLAELEIQADLPLHALRRLVYVLAVTRALTAMPMASRNASGTIAHAPPPPPEDRDRAPTIEFQRVTTELVGTAQRTAARDEGPISDARALIRPPAATVPQTSAQAWTERAGGRYHVHRPVDAETELPAEAVELGLPRDLPPALVLWRDEILARVEAIDRSSYYELLGVANDATIVEVSRAFKILEKRFDPDALPDELAGIKEQALMLRAHLRQAHATLSDRNQRDEYDREMDEGAGTSPKRHEHARQIEADAHYRRAESLLKQNDYVGAQREVERAITEGGESARYEATYGWVLYLRSGTPGNVQPRVMEHIERALEIDPDCEQALYCKATLLKHQGKHGEAQAYWLRLLALNPDHALAARELRIYEMRGQADSDGASILKRMFGRQNR